MILLTHRQTVSSTGSGAFANEREDGTGDVNAPL